MTGIMNRRFSSLDDPLNPQHPEGVPSHRCLILDQSFEALKSARSSTEAMKGVQQEMERVVDIEVKKNEQYKKIASKYTSFTEEIGSTDHEMNSLMNISTDNTSLTTPKASENAGQTQDSQDCGQIEKHEDVKNKI